MQGFDVVSAYPHSPIDEEIYCEAPEGYLCKTQGNVLLLKKALYSTNQAAHCWWKFFPSVLKVIGCAFCVSNQFLYVLQYKADMSILWIHVDDGQIYKICNHLFHSYIYFFILLLSSSIG